MTLEVTAIHHVTIGCALSDLPALLEFYTRVIRLQEGFRPALRHPGHWLYAGGHAIVHLNAMRQSSSLREGGAIDHIAFQAHNLRATREALRAADIPFSEAPLAGTTLHQIFLIDPLGVRVELNFDAGAEGLTLPSSSA